MPTPFSDKTGMKFGYWIVLGFAGRDKAKATVWSCECECGAKKDVKVGSLQKGLSKSCGCKSKELRAPKLFKHGLAGTLTYKSWHSMLQRAEGKGGHESYPERGIGVCDQWSDILVFVADMGLRPDGKTLDRIDNTKGYSPENCQWATPKQQMNNTSANIRFVIDGLSITAAQAADKYGIGISAIRHRLRKGVPPEIALTVKHFYKRDSHA